jgi:hypothetical protein
MTDLENILALLPKLSALDLNEVRKRITFLRSTSVVVDDGTLVLESLAYFMKRVGSEFFSIEALKASPQFPSFRDKLPVVMRYLRSAKLSQVEQRYVLDLAFDLLYRFIAKRGQPVGPRLLMAQVHRIPDVLNNQFPGYASSGLLRMIARRELKDTPNVRHQ